MGYRKGSRLVAWRDALRRPLRMVVMGSRIGRAWGRIVATRLEWALVDGTAFIPGLGLSEQSPIVERALDLAGRTGPNESDPDMFLRGADAEEEMELVIDVDIDEAE